MNTESIEFEGAHGAPLSGRLERPVGGDPIGYALFAHCFTCSKDLRAAVEISRALARRGIATLRFDFTGIGESAGEFAETRYATNVEDLVAAAEFLAERWEAPRLLVGHSLGGAAVLSAASALPAVGAVATIGAPARPDNILRLIDPDAAAPDGTVALVLNGRTFRVRSDFVDILEADRMDATIRDLRRPLLVLHAPLDEVVGIDNAARIFQAARHPRSFISLDDADHLLTSTRDSRYAAEVIAAWAGRYLEDAAPAEAAPERAEGFVATTTGRDGYRTEVRARRHRWTMDEPVAVGGADLGPTPYELLAAALGACTGMTLRMYAERKGWPLEEVTVQLEHARIHAVDEQECDTREPRLDRMQRTVALAGELDDAQRARLLEIADRCPVHRTLSAGILIHAGAEGEPAQVDPAVGDGTADRSREGDDSEADP
jgi:uncharacterized OsmC-like protein/fermentation-respiration switch protein FrsA (DUF1100 family)